MMFSGVILELTNHIQIRSSHGDSPAPVGSEVTLDITIQDLNR